MKREPLESSSLASAGYDAARRVMEVEFLNGGVYEYGEMPEDVYRDFLAAESKGVFLNRVIKPNHPCRKLQAAARG